MNPQTIYAHCNTDTSTLPLNAQRDLMHAALNVGLPANAVDVAKKDATGTLKKELEGALKEMIQRQYRSMSEDEMGYAPSSSEEKALTELER